MSKLVRESLFDDVARYKVVNTVSGEVIDDDMPKKLAQKLAAKKKEWSVGLDSKNARPVKESLNEKRRGVNRALDNEGHKYGSKKSHWDKQGFRKHDSERSGKESYKGDVVSLLKHDHYEYTRKVEDDSFPADAAQGQNKAVLEYIERIASWLDIEL